MNWHLWTLLENEYENASVTKHVANRQKPYVKSCHLWDNSRGPAHPSAAACASRSLLSRASCPGTKLPALTETAPGEDPCAAAPRTARCGAAAAVAASAEGMLGRASARPSRPWVKPLGAEDPCAEAAGEAAGERGGGLAVQLAAARVWVRAADAPGVAAS